MKKKSLILFFALHLLIAAFLEARPIFVFDIHGVLLRDSIASLVEKKIILILAQNRGISDNPLVKELNQLMATYRPLGNPTPEYSTNLGIPYEIFALFSGIKSPEEVKEAVLRMIETAPLETKKAAMFETLIHTIFDNAERISALTAIPTSIALLQSLASDPTNQIYIYSNAPQEWIGQYRTLFPHIFAAIPEDHILCSGHTGHVKPSAAAFEAICAKAQCKITDIILIDDSAHNCAAAQQLGATALHFLTPITPEVAALKANKREE